MNVTQIQETYKNMYDQQLLDLAIEDGLNLTADAYKILREELKKRNIGSDIIQKLDHEIIFQNSLSIKNFKEKITEDLYENALQYALAQKNDRKSDYDIYSGLIEMGIPEPNANTIVNDLGSLTSNLHADSKLNVQAGVGITIVGLIAVFISLKIEHFIIPSFILVLIGIIKIFISLSQKTKYKQIQNNIDENNTK